MRHWYEKIKTKIVICKLCGAMFRTKLAPYYSEHKICLDCEDVLRSSHR